jgi:hypothetical protein
MQFRYKVGMVPKKKREQNGNCIKGMKKFLAVTFAVPWRESLKKLHTNFDRM